MLEQALIPLILLYSLVGEGYYHAMQPFQGTKYKKAPMTMAMYKYLKAPGVRSPDQPDRQLTQIALQHVPIGTPIKDALNTFTKNRFECGGPEKLNLKNDEEYACDLWDITRRSFWVRSHTVFWIDVKEGKVSDIRGDFGTDGP